MSKLRLLEVQAEWAIRSAQVEINGMKAALDDAVQAEQMWGVQSAITQERVEIYVARKRRVKEAAEMRDAAVDAAVAERGRVAALPWWKRWLEAFTG